MSISGILLDLPDDYMDSLIFPWQLCKFPDYHDFSEYYIIWIFDFSLSFVQFRIHLRAKKNPSLNARVVERSFLSTMINFFPVSRLFSRSENCDLRSAEDGKRHYSVFNACVLQKMIVSQNNAVW